MIWAKRVLQLAPYVAAAAWIFLVNPLLWPTWWVFQGECAATERPLPPAGRQSAREDYAFSYYYPPTFRNTLMRTNGWARLERKTALPVRLIALQGQAEMRDPVSHFDATQISFGGNYGRQGPPRILCECSPGMPPAQEASALLRYEGERKQQPAARLVEVKETVFDWDENGLADLLVANAVIEVDAGGVFQLKLIYENAGGAQALTEDRFPLEPGRHSVKLEMTGSRLPAGRLRRTAQLWADSGLDRLDLGSRRDELPNELRGDPEHTRILAAEVEAELFEKASPHWYRARVEIPLKLPGRGEFNLRATPLPEADAGSMPVHRRVGPLAAGRHVLPFTLLVYEERLKGRFSLGAWEINGKPVKLPPVRIRFRKAASLR
jgi:hypothetical protein